MTSSSQGRSYARRLKTLVRNPSAAVRQAIRKAPVVIHRRRPGFAYASQPFVPDDGTDARTTYRTLRRARAVHVDQPLVLVSQVQRSGGTLLSQLFDGHPQCFAHPYELKWQRPKWQWPQLDVQADPDVLFHELAERWAAVQAARGFYSKGVKTDPLSKPESTHPFLFDVELQRLVFADAVRSGRRDQRAVLDAYFTSFFNAWGDYGDLLDGPKRYVTAFVPRLVHEPTQIDAFFRDYPDGYLISVIRHPGGWYASAAKHGYVEDLGSTQAVIRLWLESVEGARVAAERHPGRVLAVNFEQLVAEPQLVMKEVSSFIGIDDDEILSRPTFNRRPITSDSHFEPVPFVDADVAERYKRELPPEVLAEIERLALPTYESAVRELGR